MKKLKCPNCLKLVSETDNCDGCDKTNLSWCEKGSEGELAFCGKCEKGRLIDFHQKKFLKRSKNPKVSTKSAIFLLLDNRRW